MSKLSFKLLILAFLLLLAVPARAHYDLAKPSGFVADFAGVLDTKEKSTLETKLTQFEKDSSNEIAVVFINSLDGDTIENFAVKLFEDWGIGKEDKDNGVLFLAAIDDRQVRIEVGYGLEGALTDIQSKKILNEIVAPNFKNGDYYAGANLAVDRVMAITKGEYMPSTSNSVKPHMTSDAYFWLVIFGFYLLVALKRFLAKSKSWWQGGVIGAVLGVIIALIFFSSLWIFSTIFFAVVGLGFDYMVSHFKIFKNKPSKGRNNFWFFGGPRGGSGGGFGGFGGGFSGGGGASGGW